MSERLIAAFRGQARCRREAGAVQWCIDGTDRDTGVALEVLLSGAVALQLPALLSDATLYVMDESASPWWELRSAGQSQALAVRAVQVHRDAASAFYNALPQQVAPATARLGWIALLNVLRVPGLAQLLHRLRGAADQPDQHETVQ